MVVVCRTAVDLSGLLQTNPDYESTYVFNNDFAALLPDAPEPGKHIIRAVGGVLINVGEDGGWGCFRLFFTFAIYLHDAFISSRHVKIPR